jgi:hypothetical protein
MLPPHRPFVEKVVRRRTVRRAAAAHAAKPERSESEIEALRVPLGKRTAQRVKPVLKVLAQAAPAGATQG